MTLIPQGSDESQGRRTIGPIDEQRMQAAADKLRERTMSLEPPHSPGPWIFATVVLAVIVLVGLLFAYRQPLIAMLGRAGL